MDSKVRKHFYSTLSVCWPCWFSYSVYSLTYSGKKKTLNTLSIMHTKQLTSILLVFLCIFCFTSWGYGQTEQKSTVIPSISGWRTRNWKRCRKHITQIYRTFMNWPYRYRKISFKDLLPQEVSTCWRKVQTEPLSPTSWIWLHPTAKCSRFCLSKSPIKNSASFMKLIPCQVIYPQTNHKL